MPLTQVFVSISDPRSARQVRHDLSELLTVAVCAVLCSADEFSDIEAQGSRSYPRDINRRHPHRLQAPAGLPETHRRWQPAGAWS